MIRRIIACMALLAGLLSAPVGAQTGAVRFSAMTYNIRLDLASDGANSWPNRRAAVASLVRYYAPDLIGMQEVLPQQRAAIVADLSDYTFVGAPRDDGKAKGEASPIGFRHARYALRASGTFWLSPTPEVPGKGWDAAYPRVATWARLVDRSGLRLLVVNTHLDNVGQTARREGAAMIRRWIESHRVRGEAVVLMGDFNSPVGDPAYSTIVAPGGGGLRDTLAITRSPHFGPAGTFNGFKIEEAQASPIDHIFVSSGIAVLRHATLTQHDAGRLPSDHYPVLADLCIGRGC